MDYKQLHKVWETPELATLEWVDWFNKTRLHSTIGYVSPFEFEKQYYNNLNLLGEAA